jgi:hypothetical protein
MSRAGSGSSLFSSLSLSSSDSWRSTWCDGQSKKRSHSWLWKRGVRQRHDVMGRVTDSSSLAM